MVTTTFENVRGRRVYLAAAPDTQIDPVKGWTVADFAPYLDLSSGIMVHAKRTVASPIPSANRPIEQIPTVQDGNVPEPGDEVFGDIPLVIYASSDNVEAYKMALAAYESQSTLVYLVVRENLTDAHVCAVHVGQADEGGENVGKATLLTTLAVQDNAFKVEVTGA